MTPDPLKAYKSKRDFTKTAEPAGKVGATSATGGRFVVQKHGATRLHFDFRLELDGVLKSWAVTKGPSNNPADKRLAVRVEDHPLDYGSFEGTIPEGEYGGGTVMLWDEGTWEPVGDPHEGLEDGDLKFVLRGKRLKGSWVLVHMKGRDQQTKHGPRENWLLIKHKDRYAKDEDTLIERFTTSVQTGRDLDGIAKGNKPRRKAAGKVHSAALSAAPAKVAHKRKPREADAMTFTDQAGIAAAERLGVRLTHPDRVVYPDTTITKAQLVAYYDAVAPRLLPHLTKRPLSLVRAPQGQSSHGFFQKHASEGFPTEFKIIPIVENDGDKADYLYVDGLEGVVAGVQMNSLEFHIWGSRIDNLEKPDRLVFDIDPDEGLDFAAVRDAATSIRDRLLDLDLKSFAMVSGGKGVHVIVPLRRRLEWPAVKAFCHGFAERLAEDEPKRFTANIRKASRTGRLFVDYLRNERGSTAIAPFSTRNRPGAPCAVPVTWEELSSLGAASQFSIGEAAAHAARPDPWPDYVNLNQSIKKSVLDAFVGDKL